MRADISKWGKDHWSMLGYLGCRVVDNCGTINNLQLRIDGNRHPGLAHRPLTEQKHPTRLKNNEILNDHDDWDCAEDLEEAGFIKIGGTGLYPIVKLTDKGAKTEALLRTHKAQGGMFYNFVYEEESIRGT